MNLNRENVIKIICILAIFSNFFLIVNNYIVPYINNYNVRKQYEKYKKEKKLNAKDEIDTSEIQNEDVKQEKFVYDEYKDLLKKDELERMKDYVGKYITFLNEKDYTSAYNLLYDEFKNNKFKTLNEFEEYAKKTYPDDMYIEFNDLHRYGYYYMYEVTLLDMNEIGQDEKNNKVSTIFTIKENAIADYVLSFGV